MADNRNSGYCLRVPVRGDEAVAIKSQARRCGLSTAAYLRNLGLGFPVAGVFDAEAVLELSRLNRDLNRIGTLLEQWLMRDDRLTVQDRATLTRTISGVLSELRGLQAVLLTAAKRL
jgi:hypothetical protein